MAFKYSQYFFQSQNATNMKKTLAGENRMAQRLGTASKLTFAKEKYSIYDNKNSGSIQFKEQYSLGQLSLPCTHMAFFLECQIVH